MVGMDAFFTRDKANKGIKVPLRTPEGKETEHFLVIRSQWSDDFQKAKAEAYRDEFAAIAGKGEVKAEDRTVILAAALVADWSFDEECTPENVQNLLRNAPQLRDMIDRYASNDARFFTKPSSDSTTGRKGK
ncbi:hypothetical protein [Marinobacter sp. Hex_13]|uniref:hypothetical protein n=1 Tax=Marinobacter sp. Hex_13 TaxID=1795866 RepID=UPI000791AF93|nr:hypothetical protein [Marinobacter sp. Hex_13]KXJ45892.1 MAG: hypothetical protein AXW11_12445 [Marinobacter sp. Hex_13]